MVTLDRPGFGPRRFDRWRHLNLPTTRNKTMNDIDSVPDYIVENGA